MQASINVQRTCVGAYSNDAGPQTKNGAEDSRPQDGRRMIMVLLQSDGVVVDRNFDTLTSPVAVESHPEEPDPAPIKISSSTIDGFVQVSIQEENIIDEPVQKNEPDELSSSNIFEEPSTNPPDLPPEPCAPESSECLNETLESDWSVEVEVKPRSEDQNLQWGSSRIEKEEKILADLGRTRENELWRAGRSSRWHYTATRGSQHQENFAEGDLNGGRGDGNGRMTRPSVSRANIPENSLGNVEATSKGFVGQRFSYNRPREQFKLPRNGRKERQDLPESLNVGCSNFRARPNRSFLDREFRVNEEVNGNDRSPCNKPLRWPGGSRFRPIRTFSNRTGRVQPSLQLQNYGNEANNDRVFQSNYGAALRELEVGNCRSQLGCQVAQEVKDNDPNADWRVANGAEGKFRRFRKRKSQWKKREDRTEEGCCLNSLGASQSASGMRTPTRVWGDCLNEGSPHLLGLGASPNTLLGHRFYAAEQDRVCENRDYADNECYDFNHSNDAFNQNQGFRFPKDQDQDRDQNILDVREQIHFGDIPENKQDVWSSPELQNQPNFAPPDRQLIYPTLTYGAIPFNPMSFPLMPPPQQPWAVGQEMCPPHPPNFDFIAPSPPHEGLHVGLNPSPFIGISVGPGPCGNGFHQNNHFSNSPPEVMQAGGNGNRPFRRRSRSFARYSSGFRNRAPLLYNRNNEDHVLDQLDQNYAFNRRIPQPQPPIQSQPITAAYANLHAVATFPRFQNAPTVHPFLYLQSDCQPGFPEPPFQELPAFQSYLEHIQMPEDIHSSIQEGFQQCCCNDYGVIASLNPDAPEFVPSTSKESSDLLCSEPAQIDSNDQIWSEEADEDINVTIDQSVLVNAVNGFNETQTDYSDFINQPWLLPGRTATRYGNYPLFVPPVPQPPVPVFAYGSGCPGMPPGGGPNFFGYGATGGPFPHPLILNPLAAMFPPPPPPPPIMEPVWTQNVDSGVIVSDVCAAVLEQNHEINNDPINTSDDTSSTDSKKPSSKDRSGKSPTIESNKINVDHQTCPNPTGGGDATNDSPKQNRNFQKRSHSEPEKTSKFPAQPMNGYKLKTHPDDVH